MSQSKEYIVKIDARSAGYEGEPIRVMAITMTDSGKILIAKQADWKEQTTPQDDVVVITDTPQIFSHWSMAFYERENIKDLLRTYLEVKRSGLLKVEENMRMFDPENILQMSRMGEDGQILEFDTGVTNGHVAVLLAIWGARKAYGGYVTTVEAERDIDDTNRLIGYSNNDDYDVMMPFSVL